MATSKNQLHRWAAIGLVFALPLGCVIDIDDPPPIDQPELDASLSSCLRAISALDSRDDIQSCVYIDQLPCTLQGSVTNACPSASGGCTLSRLEPSNATCVDDTTGGLVFDNPESLPARIRGTLILVHGDEVCPARGTSCEDGSSVAGRTEGGCFAKADFDLELDDLGRLAPANDRPDLAIGAFFERELSIENQSLTAPCDGVDVLPATETVGTRSVSIDQLGRGVGRVTSRDPGVNCPEKARDQSRACPTVTLPEGGTLVLDASPDDQSQVTDEGWTGCDTVTNGQCIVRTSSAVSATFELQRRTLMVDVDAGGVAGPQVVADIRDADGRLVDCFDGAGDCMGSFAAGDTVVLTAADQGGVLFTGWGGECQAFGNSNECTLTMDRNLNVSASYVQATTVEVAWNGPGRVVPNIAGFNCPAQSPCIFAVETGSTLTLQATSEGDGAGLIRWVGADCDSDDDCTITPSGNRLSVEARFGWEMSLGLLGAAPDDPLQGSLVSVPSGLQLDFADFTGTTSALFEPDSQVTLTVSPGTNTNLASWGGACAVFRDALQCTVTMDSRKTVRFAVCDCQSITVNLPGSGEITSTPGNLLGTACVREGCTDEDSCKLWFDRGEVVTLQANPSSRGLGYSFGSGWSGAGCFGSGGCTIALNDSVEVTAGFDYPVSYQSDIFEGILQAGGLNCVFCHNPNPPPFGIPAAETGLLYSLTAAEVRQLIIQEPAQGECAIALGESGRINETNVADSIIVRFPLPEGLNGCEDHGLQNGFVSTTDSRYLDMFNWIAGGCPSN